jgi:hypothetical protein
MGIWVRGDGYDVIPLPVDENVFKIFTHVAYLARQSDTIKSFCGQPLPRPALGGAA